MFRGRGAWPSYSREEIVKRSRLLVVDDSEFYYLDLFKRDGYTMEKWSDIADMPKLETGYFDVILLDIQGVGRSYSASEQGLGVLRHIKKNNPAQLVIAYSNAEYALKYREFFDLADASLSKGEDYVRFKEEVDSLLAKRFSFDYYVDKIAQIAPSSSKEATRLSRLARKSIVSGKLERLRAFLDGAKDYASLAATIVQIVHAAISAKSGFPTNP